jgi:hypothetical protein
MQDGLFGGPLVNQHADIFYFETEAVEEDVPDVGNVVDTALKVSARHPAVVDSDEEGFMQL